MSDYIAALARIEAAIYAVWPLSLITEEATGRAKKDVLEAIQGMKYSAEQGQKYIDAYPHLVKWINQCVRCQAQGYRPYLPQGYKFDVIRKHFRPLGVNELGLCEICSNGET